MTGWVDRTLERQNLQRHVAISVPHFLAAPFIVANTNLVVTLAERVAKTYLNGLNLRFFRFLWLQRVFLWICSGIVKIVAIKLPLGYEELFLS